MLTEIDRYQEMLRCPACAQTLSFKPGEEYLECGGCGERFPVIDEIPRLLLSPLREALLKGREVDDQHDKQTRTARSFGYEWSRFPEMYSEWEQSFLEYMKPHGPEFFAGKTVLDAGCGSGRFAYYAGKYGAEVWAIDVGAAVEVTRRNTIELENVRVIQADLHSLPFAPETFDFVYSIGVLHHLTDPEAAFQSLLRYLKPGGDVQIYLYWHPEGQPVKRVLLESLALVRRLTTRLPHVVVHAFSFPAAMLAFLLFVWPYKFLRRLPRLSRFAERLPMKQYANFPFRVCVNDQFDRFSAPIENRYSKQQVTDWLRRANLNQLTISPFYGWVASGTKPK